MLVRADGEYETEEEELEVKDVSEAHGLVAVTRRALSTQTRSQEDMQ